MKAMVTGGGSSAVVVALESGATRLVVDGEGRDAELLGESMPVSFMTVSEADGLFAVGTQRGYWLIGDADAGVILRQGQIGDTAVLSIAIAADGRSVEVIGGNGRRERVELLAPRIVRSWPVPGFMTLDGTGDDDAQCPDMALAPSGNRIALRTADGLAVFDRDGRAVSRFRDDTPSRERVKTTFEFDPTGRWILFGHFFEPLKVIDAETGRAAEGPRYPEAIDSDIRYSDRCPPSFAGGLAWKDPAHLLLPTIDGEETWSVTAGGDGVPVLKLERTDEEHFVDNTPKPFPTLFPAPAGDREVFQEIGGVPVLRRRSDGQTVATLQAFGTYVDRIVFSPDGTRLVLVSSTSGQDDEGRAHGGYVLVDTADGHVIREVRGWILDGSRYDFSPDSRYLMASPTGGVDMAFSEIMTQTELVDARTGAQLAVLTAGFGSGMRDAKVGGYADHGFAADGTRLYAVRQSGRVDAWSLP
jgi:hypothetical protein